MGQSPKCMIVLPGKDIGRMFTETVSVSSDVELVAIWVTNQDKMVPKKLGEHDLKPKQSEEQF